MEPLLHWLGQLFCVVTPPNLKKKKKKKKCCPPYHLQRYINESKACHHILVDNGSDLSATLAYNFDIGKTRITSHKF